MRRLCMTALLVLVAGLSASAQRKETPGPAQRAASGPAQKETFSPPPLNAVASVTLSPPYSCRTPEEFHKGYRKTALFLSELVKRYNSPDLLFNGACGSENYFEAATHGANKSAIADLGPSVSLESVPPLEALLAASAASEAGGSKPHFRRAAPVKTGHTYAVRITNSRLVEGWFVFTVTRHEPNKLAEISYTVREYRLLDHGIPPPPRAGEDDETPPAK